MSPQPLLPKLYLNGDEIENVSSHKHLGVFLNSAGNWTTHLDELKCKVSKRIGTLRYLKYRLNRSSLRTIYLSFIRPILEYCDAVWDNLTARQIIEIEALQYESIRIITGLPRYCSLGDLLTEVGLSRLQTRRSHHRLIQMFKIKNNIGPSYLSDLLPRPRVETHQRVLRDFGNIERIDGVYVPYRNTFLPRTVDEWNLLQPSQKLASSISAFKRKLPTPDTPWKLYLTESSRKFGIIHTKLRNKCSALNAELFRVNLKDDPTCRCGLASETSKHFLLECPIHLPLRQIMTSNIQAIAPNSRLTVKLLLFGNQRLTLDINKQVFLEVQSFIGKTNRF